MSELYLDLEAGGEESRSILIFCHADDRQVSGADPRLLEEVGDLAVVFFI